MHTEEIYYIASISQPVSQSVSLFVSCHFKCKQKKIAWNCKSNLKFMKTSSKLRPWKQVNTSSNIIRTIQLGRVGCNMQYGCRLFEMHAKI
jgi:UV DNA damage repair endonuclease